ncbi:MAG: type secretion protein [Paraburkholderia sp.]|jgi:type III secretion protein D|nr:type secretion protein [Paraburkholderia sp.]
MKALRVLTGTHAGAQIRLAGGTYRIGAAEDADICVSDWQVDELTLIVGEDGVTRLRPGNGDELLVADFVAVPFGDVVFCVGPDDAQWPRDLDLLAGLWKTAEPAPQGDDDGDGHGRGVVDFNVDVDGDGGVRREATPREMTWRTAAVALACTAVICALVTAGVMFAGTQPSEAASVKVDVNALSKQVTAALHRTGLADLSAAPRGAQVAVRGIVTSASDSEKARRIIDDLARGRASAQYDVADDDVDNIQQSLAGTGAEVSYSGHGVFRVSGNVRSMSTFRERVGEVRADLDSNVKRIDVDVKEAASPQPNVEYTEVVATGGLRYIQTPDGTKHLFEGADGKNHDSD